MLEKQAPKGSHHYDTDYDFKLSKARGGGKSKNNTKKDAQKNKNQSCYNKRHIRITENKKNKSKSNC